MRQRFSLRRVFELRLVAAAEVLESGGVMAVPLAQFSRRRDVLAPVIEGRPGLGQPPRPDAVHQDPGAVAQLWLVIHPAYLNHSSRHVLPPPPIEPAVQSSWQPRDSRLWLSLIRFPPEALPQRGREG